MPKKLVAQIRLVGEIDLTDVPEFGPDTDDMEKVMAARAAAAEKAEREASSVFAGLSAKGVKILDVSVDEVRDAE